MVIFFKGFSVNFNLYTTTPRQVTHHFQKFFIFFLWVTNGLKLY